jgi:hypothetical protein
MSPSASGAFRLFVEGRDDKYSIINLLQRHGYDWNKTSLAPYVHDSGGIEPLFEALPAALKTLVRVGVVIDADLSPTNRWARIEAILQVNGIVGVLEDFLQGLVPTGDRCWQHADTSTRQARALGAPLADNDHTKGAIHTWLAWQDPPGQPFGTALNARILNHDSPEALEFVAWFNRLFQR